MHAATTIMSKRRRGRPPKGEENYSETREALIYAGLEVLTEKGFSASGIDEILRRVSVPKGSFYHYFASKEAFGMELIEHYAAYFSRKLEWILSDETLPPLQRLQAFVTDAAKGMARYKYTRGCLVGNLGQEMGSLPEKFRGCLKRAFADWQRYVEKCLIAAKSAGEIPSTSDCKKIAEVFWIGWEGAVLRAKLERSSKPLKLFTEFFLAGISC